MKSANNQKAPGIKELRAAVREFLRELESSPFWAVDCDQEKVWRLMEKISKMSGYKDS